MFGRYRVRDLIGALTILINVHCGFSFTLDESQNCTVPLSRIQILTLKNFPVFRILLSRSISVQLAV